MWDRAQFSSWEAGAAPYNDTPHPLSLLPAHSLALINPCRAKDAPVLLSLLLSHQHEEHGFFTEFLIFKQLSHCRGPQDAPFSSRTLLQGVRGSCLRSLAEFCLPHLLSRPQPFSHTWGCC